MGGKYFGSLVAAPVVSAVFEEAPYLGYLEEYTEEEYQKLNVVVPDVVGKDITSVQETLKGLNLNPR